MAVWLAHAGRKSECEGLIAPSAVKFSESYKTPRQMSAEDIVSVKQAFTRAAVRAQRAGYSATEIHAAHGYLISEFLSLGVNQRDDEYGGSFENRTRFLKEILSEIKAAVKISASMRISADSWVKGDWSLEDSVRLARELEIPCAAFIHVSACGLFESTDTRRHLRLCIMRATLSP